MSNDKHFFLRDHWEYDPNAPKYLREDADRGIETKSLHSGFHPYQNQDGFRSFTPPLVQSVTYPYETFDKVPCPVYGRTRTPTNTVLEERLAAMEGGQACITAGSGSQALFELIFTMARPGDNVVTSLNIFGEGYKQATDIFPQRCQVDFRFVQDPGEPNSWAREIDNKTKLIWIETPSNPCLFITDIKAVSDAAHAKGVPVLVDNTTATAVIQRPLELGADFVLLSISKFLAGNGTMLGGAMIGPEGLIEDIRWNTTEFIGAIMPPMEAWMTLQYLETLPMRMEKHSANTMVVANYLNDHPNVVHVNYSGLTDHPQHVLACRQMSGHGGLMSFVVKGGIDGAAKVMNSLKLIVHAVTFGTSRTICMHPPTITHEHMTQEERMKAGIDDGLIRLSVGLENPQDLIADLDQALTHLD
ncbi:MAG: aminotransferase class I/II-fold pyridoxal phosphate-dependent enzyme [Deltaproteobacteria bacterium]|nr:aminotransferase class I/II-fold pyridoxal phosphate-dependent enzyme [Deltaproteobacteria bacterium]